MTSLEAGPQEFQKTDIADPEAGPTASDTAVNNSSTDNQSTDPSDTRFSCVYFGYGSNLSPRTMKQRCPDSLFTGMAVVKDWKWVINETGYANIIPSAGDEVWGSLCFLSHRDEMALDESEGVPWLYEKQQLKVKRFVGGDLTGSEREIEATAYVDVQRIGTGNIEKEYIVWVDKAIKDGVKCGMPQSYADKYLAPYLPENREPRADIVMVRTTKFGEKDAGLVPRGFASWTRG